MKISEPRSPFFRLSVTFRRIEEKKTEVVYSVCTTNVEMRNQQQR